MKKILVFLAFCLTLTVSQAQRFIEYPFYADGVVEFGYLVDEDTYYIIYQDTTYFSNDEWCEESYLFLECSKKDFFDYLEWFSEELENRTDAFYQLDPIYQIVEIRKRVKGGINYQYKLVKKEIK